MSLWKVFPIGVSHWMPVQGKGGGTIVEPNSTGLVKPIESNTNQNNVPMKLIAVRIKLRLTEYDHKHHGKSFPFSQGCILLNRVCMEANDSFLDCNSCGWTTHPSEAPLANPIL